MWQESNIFLHNHISKLSFGVRILLCGGGFFVVFVWFIVSLLGFFFNWGKVGLFICFLGACGVFLWVDVLGFFFVLLPCLVLLHKVFTFCDKLQFRMFHTVTLWSKHDAVVLLNYLKQKENHLQDNRGFKCSNISLSSCFCMPFYRYLPCYLQIAFTNSCH